MRLAPAVAAALVLAASARADREPVLQQIRLPHSYYYREMYLPQATSGPTSPAWSPDGRTLAVSMQGSLWAIDPATGRARQLTNGPGYDHQPDWSPDGRFLVYASYQRDAVEIWRLEVAGGAARPLTEGGAVSVEPRFSPDGRRIAFVSTAYEGRFHVFTLDMAGDEPGTPLRLTEDKDSGLPRYYYSRFDHYLSPAWSPDGQELLLVSNRGRIWGTGGFWRMKAETGAPLRVGKPHRIEGDASVTNLGLDADATRIPEGTGDLADVDDGRSRAIDHTKLVVAGEESDLVPSRECNLG